MPENNFFFFSLFIFRGHSTLEPTTIICNDEQGDLFYSVGPPTKEPVLATANTGKTQERFWKKMQVNGLEG